MGEGRKSRVEVPSCNGIEGHEWSPHEVDRVRGVAIEVPERSPSLDHFFQQGKSHKLYGMDCEFCLRGKNKTHLIRPGVPLGIGSDVKLDFYGYSSSGNDEGEFHHGAIGCVPLVPEELRLRVDRRTSPQDDGVDAVREAHALGHRSFRDGFDLEALRTWSRVWLDVGDFPSAGDFSIKEAPLRELRCVRGNGEACREAN